MKQWYGTKRWKERRAMQLREHPLCVTCLEIEHRVVAATVADHVVPHKGNYDLFWNGRLQSLCDHHHSSLKQQEEIRGYHKTIGHDGWPVDPRHPANLKR